MCVCCALTKVTLVTSYKLRFTSYKLRMGVSKVEGSGIKALCMLYLIFALQLDLNEPPRIMIFLTMIPILFFCFHDLLP